MNNPFGNMPPEQILNIMIANNPQANQILQQMRNSGMSPKQFTLQLLRQNNIDANQFINNLGIKRNV